MFSACLLLAMADSGRITKILGRGLPLAEAAMMAEAFDLASRGSTRAAVLVRHPIPVEIRRADRRHCNRLIEASQVVDELGPIGPKPTSEAQARELARVPAEQQADVWQEVVDRTDGHPTAAAVRSVVEARRDEPQVTCWDGEAESVAMADSGRITKILGRGLPLAEAAMMAEAFDLASRGSTRAAVLVRHPIPVEIRRADRRARRKAVVA